MSEDKVPSPRAELIALCDECFEYLDAVRDSGQANMFGSSQLLIDEFGLDKPPARTIATAWMTTFDGESSIEARVATAIEQGLVKE